MTEPFFPCFEAAIARDPASEAMRAQLRSWYQWIPDTADGEANLEIRCPDPYAEGGFIGRAKKAMTDQLQAEIAQRKWEERIRAARAAAAVANASFDRYGGYEPLHVEKRDVLSVSEWTWRNHSGGIFDGDADEWVAPPCQCDVCMNG